MDYYWKLILLFRIMYTTQGEPCRTVKPPLLSKIGLFHTIRFMHILLERLGRLYTKWQFWCQYSDMSKHLPMWATMSIGIAFCIGDWLVDSTTGDWLTCYLSDISSKIKLWRTKVGNLQEKNHHSRMVELGTTTTSSSGKYISYYIPIFIYVSKLTGKYI